MPFFYTMDPLYWGIFLLTLILSGVTSLMVKGAFKKYSKVPASSGVTGAEAARRMLNNAGLTQVGIERSTGHLSDHYDPRHRVLRLSPDVHDGRSVASLGVACHEAGHAIQHAKNYSPLVIRNAVVPLAGFGSNLGMILIMIGFFIWSAGAVFGQWLAIAGLLFFAVVVFFQIVNLPVEFNASTRAKRMLPELGLISGAKEISGVNRVLNAAAMTYVAATITAVAYLLYFALRIFGGRR